MTLPKLLTLAAISLLNACSSAPSPYPRQGIGSPSQEIGYPKQGIATPQQTSRPIKTEDEDLSDQADVKNSEMPNLAK